MSRAPSSGNWRKPRMKVYDYNQVRKSLAPLHFLFIVVVDSVSTFQNYPQNQLAGIRFYSSQLGESEINSGWSVTYNLQRPI